MGIAEENCGKLVAQDRDAAAELTKKLKREMILCDGPPGTGCPVIASVSGVDLVVIVTEPTISSVHDMERVLRLTSHFGVPALLIINKSDLNTKQCIRIERIAKKRNSRVIEKIPFDERVNKALMEGKTVVQFGDSVAADAIRNVWKEIYIAASHITFPKTESIHDVKNNQNQCNPA